MKSHFSMPLLIVTLWLVAEPALAGPGGIIAKTLWNSFWGKLLLAVLVLIFLPLITLALIEEHRAHRRSRRDLRFMAGYNPLFEWLSLRERITDCFYRIHGHWSQQDLAAADNWMSDWYRQNQQMVFLDRWRRQGLVNHCEIRRINSIRPVFFAHRNVGAEHRHSMLVVSISARMKDYLAERESGRVVEGKKRFRDIETLWTLVLEDNRWRVSNIEEAASLFDYTRLARELPPIEETLNNHFQA